ncbi:Zinc finger, RING/FYVE/PHD-type [Lasallia pustulata]|uniref:Zinc finger, RING/FYVE/PHD-type n=1 Tax=Lasallia pustulata TaxID=136370 RepID=A0A1W5D4U0_9LECA|nr:Zinc finger, RING/FYVE/PHD-type [Lasallia pustulata]
MGTASAQGGGTVSPSNDTSANAPEMPAPGTPQLVLKTTQTGMMTQVNVAPLTTMAGAGNSLSQLQNIHLSGRLVLIDSSNASSNIYGSIAYISCDPDAYPGQIGPYQTVQLAANQSPSAILLYSNTSNHCVFQAAAVGSFNYDVIFTMTSANISAQLASGLIESSLMGSEVSGASTMILLDQTSLKNGSNTTSGGNNVLGPSPTTAVAMIILYSITGIITALFLVIIITGALRAHRHPERYGPRNVLGRPRQSRAKGIARAMLETLPIVKFGDQDEVKPAANNNEDIEIGASGGTQNAQVPPSDVEERSAPVEATQENHSHQGEAVKMTAEVGAIGAAEPSKADGGEEHRTDNGLACSVCTDDFIKGQDIRVLPCNHKFHPECIDPWLLNVSGTCPLCRVDLRDPTDPEPADPAAESAAPNASSSPDADPATSSTNDISTTQRRPRNGLSSYLHHSLNIRRMRDATPEERIAALMRLRTANRASARLSAGEGSENEPARNRLSARFRDALRRESGTGGAGAQR